MNGTNRNRKTTTSSSRKILSTRSLVSGSLTLNSDVVEMSSSFMKPISIDTTMMKSSSSPTSSVGTVSTRSISSSSSSSSESESVSSPSTVVSPSVSSSSSTVGEDDYQLIHDAEEAFANEKIFHAVRLLEQVHDKSLLTERHQKIFDIAAYCSNEVKDILVNDFAATAANDDDNDDDDAVPTTDGWIKQGESNNGKYDMTLYFKHNEDNMSALTTRVESAIPFRLLVPLLCVLNEVELFPTWAPPGFRKNIGLKVAKQLQQTSRVNQIAYLYRTTPWPFSPREIICQSYAIDETDAPNDYYVGLVLHSINPDDHPTIEIPMDGRSPDTVATDVTGTFLFRPCPSDHPLATAYYKKHNVQTQEPMLLVTIKLWADTHMKGIPKPFINWAMKVGTPKVWSNFMELAEQIELGQRPLHSQAIDAKPEIYNFIKQRIQALYDRMNNNTNTNTNNEGEQPQEQQPQEQQPPVAVQQKQPAQVVVPKHQEQAPEQAPPKKQQRGWRLRK